MKRCVIDTNVMVTANKAVKCPAGDDAINYPELIIECIETLQKIKKTRHTGSCRCQMVELGGSRQAMRHHHKVYERTIYDRP